jgi:hypothetical protein
MQNDRLIRRRHPASLRKLRRTRGYGGRNDSEFKNIKQPRIGTDLRIEKNIM